MTVVFDTNVFVSATISQIGSARRCFVLLAQRRFRLAVTKQILLEYKIAAEELTLKSEKYHGLNWQPLFHWIQDKAICFEPSPMGKQRSRDADDDIFLACALAGGAKMIVSHDKDLLDLKKPFGIEILKPAIFVARFK